MPALAAWIRSSGRFTKSDCAAPPATKPAIATDGAEHYSPRMWDEFKTATHLQKVRARDARVGGAEAYAALFSGNRDIVKQIWGTEVGRIAPGARADLLLVDYLPPTPIDSSNLFGHLLFGVSN